MRSDLVVAILPRAARFDEECLDPKSLKPVPDRNGSELRTIVRSNVLRWSMLQEQLGQCRQDRFVVQFSRGSDRQAFACMLFDHRQHPEATPILGAIHDKVVGPDMVAVLGPEPNAGAVIEPQPGPLGLLAGNLEPLPTPDPLHALVVHIPARVSEQARDPAVAIAAILGSQVEDSPCQGSLVITLDQHPALGGSGLPDHLASPTFRDMKGRCDMADRLPAPFGAQ